MNNQETRRPTHPKESYTHEHGLHRLNFSSGETVTAVSAQTWSGYLSYLKQINRRDKLVVSPELMTFTGRPLHEVSKARDEIENRIDEIKKFSIQHPNTTFLLGTPTFEMTKPRNSILVIKVGEVIGQTHKRSGATAKERDNFDLPVEELPMIIPGTDIGVLICADLATTSIFLRPGQDQEIFNEALRRSGRESFVGKQPTFLHPQTKKLILPSCWGVGGNQQLIKPGDANNYYKLQLRNLAWSLFENSKLEEIIIVDRTPIMPPNLQPFTSTKPYNGIIQKR